MLKNTGKVVKGRNVHQRNYVVRKADVSLVPRVFVDVASHYVGSFLSGVTSPPTCKTMFPHSFHTRDGDSKFGWWCGKHDLTHDNLSLSMTACTLYGRRHVQILVNVVKVPGWVPL